MCPSNQENFIPVSLDFEDSHGSSVIEVNQESPVALAVSRGGICNHSNRSRRRIVARKRRAVRSPSIFKKKIQMCDSIL